MLKLLFPLITFLALACSSTPSGTEVDDPKGLEFRTAAAADDPTATEFEHGESTLRLGPAQSFDLSRAYATVDALGLPALGFEVGAADAARFTDWTDSIVGQRLAILFDGKVITAPVVESALPAKGVIAKGVDGFTDAQIAELLAAMKPGGQ